MRILDEFPKTAMARKATDVWTAATRGPVSLTDHGKSRFVLMPRDMFDNLISCSDPRIVRGTADTPKGEAGALLVTLEGVTNRDD